MRENESLASLSVFSLASFLIIVLINLCFDFLQLVLCSAKRLAAGPCSAKARRKKEGGLEGSGTQAGQTPLWLSK